MILKQISPAKAQRRKVKPQRNAAWSPAGFAPLRLCASICLLLCLASCKREQRQFSTPPANFKSYDVTMSDIRPGIGGMPQPVQNPADQHAFDANEGKRLFS